MGEKAIVKYLYTNICIYPIYIINERMCDGKKEKNYVT